MHLLRIKDHFRMRIECARRQCSAGDALDETADRHTSLRFQRHARLCRCGVAIVDFHK